MSVATQKTLLKTPLEVKRNYLLQMEQKAKSNFSFKKLKTLKDLLLLMGHSEGEIDYIYNGQGSQPITFPQIVSYFKSQHILNEQHNGPTPVYNTLPVPHEYEGFKYELPLITKVPPKESNISEVQNVLSKANTDLSNVDPNHNTTWTDDKFHKRQVCRLYWHQRDGAKALLDGILLHQRRCQLMLAKTGDGKTFIAGAIMRRLIDMKWHEDKTISPWPYMYITKATVVEQAERVFRHQFGLNVGSDVHVINIEQLRSKFGQVFMREETKIENGEPTVNFIWRQMVNPLLMFLDECQVVKNEDSTQSKIIQKYAKVDKTYMIFSSATPFTRVAEAKAFVLNCHIPLSAFGME